MDAENEPKVGQLPACLQALLDCDSAYSRKHYCLVLPSSNRWDVKGRINEGNKCLGGFS